MKDLTKSTSTSLPSEMEDYIDECFHAIAVEDGSKCISLLQDKRKENVIPMLRQELFGVGMVYLDRILKEMMNEFPKLTSNTPHH
jgi:hypothetical protein